MMTTTNSKMMMTLGVWAWAWADQEMGVPRWAAPPAVHHCPLHCTSTAPRCAMSLSLPPTMMHPQHPLVCHVTNSNATSTTLSCPMSPMTTMTTMTLLPPSHMPYHQQQQQQWHNCYHHHSLMCHITNDNATPMNHITNDDTTPDHQPSAWLPSPPSWPFQQAPTPQMTPNATSHGYLVTTTHPPPTLPLIAVRNHHLFEKWTPTCLTLHPCSTTNPHPFNNPLAFENKHLPFQKPTSCFIRRWCCLFTK